GHVPDDEHQEKDEKRPPPPAFDQLPAASEGGAHAYVLDEHRGRDHNPHHKEPRLERDRRHAQQDRDQPGHSKKHTETEQRKVSSPNTYKDIACRQRPYDG